MTINSKIITIVLTIAGDAIVTFIVFCFLLIYFSTTPKISCEHTGPKTAESVEKACREYLPFFNLILMSEIFIGLILIGVSNYFIFRPLFKKPLVAMIVALIAYIILVGLIY
jgi:hypothetical protein